MEAFLPILYYLTVVFGIICNYIMIKAIWKSRLYRSSCHILIMLSCFAELLQLYGMVITATQLLFDLDMTHNECFYYKALGLIGTVFSFLLEVSVGIDRLLAIVMPLKYHILQSRKPFYITVILIPPVVASTVFLGSALLYLDPPGKPNRVAVCGIINALGSVTYEMFYYTTIVLCILLPIMYFILWRLSIKRLGASYRSVFNSIFITVLMLIFGWLASLFLTNVDAAFESLWILYPAWFMKNVSLNISSVGKIFVFYIKSAEYRLAIRNVLHLKHEIEIGPITTKIPAITTRNSTN